MAVLTLLGCWEKAVINVCIMFNTLPGTGYGDNCVTGVASCFCSVLGAALEARSWPGGVHSLTNYPRLDLTVCHGSHGR